MNYREAMEYVESLKVYGSVPGLSMTKALCARLGDPQKQLKFVHIAGTNGKGSVLAYVSAVLQAAGYRVGRYLSPTLFDYRERFQIDARPITQSALCKYIERIKAAVEQMEASGEAALPGEDGPHPTLFEVETALAFLYFMDKKCDIVVLETGMGGRLDATNIIPAPICAVITSISMDHMAYLGDTLTQIATEKAGIIKSGSIVVSARQKPEAMQIIKQAAAKCKCRIFIADTSRIKGVKSGLKKQCFSYNKYKNMEIGMPGLYQLDNAILAVEVIDALQKQGFKIEPDKVKSGLSQAKWPGRFEIIGQKPLFIIDGAHNEDGAARLAQTIAHYFEDRRIIAIVGVLADKEAEKILSPICPLTRHLITVTVPDNPRAMHAYALAGLATEYHDSVTVADSLEEAVEMAYLLAGKDKETVVIAFGSLSYLGALSHIVEHRDTIRRDFHGRSE